MSLYTPYEWGLIRRLLVGTHEKTPGEWVEIGPGNAENAHEALPDLEIETFYRDGMPLPKPFPQAVGPAEEYIRITFCE